MQLIPCLCLYVALISPDQLMSSASHLACVVLRAQGSAVWILVQFGHIGFVLFYIFINFE